MATVKVFQGERLMAKNNRLLGSFQIKGRLTCKEAFA